MLNEAILAPKEMQPLRGTGEARKRGWACSMHHHRDSRAEGIKVAKTVLRSDKGKSIHYQRPQLMFPCELPNFLEKSKAWT